MKSFLLLLLVPSFASAQYKTSSYLRNATNITNHSIVIDSTYAYYIREVYKEDLPDTKRQQTFSEKQDSSHLIEVEYLFVSQQHNNVIYIATVPDKYLEYYGNDNRYKGAHYVNVYDFKKIFTGKLTAPNTFQFISKNGKSRDLWIINPTDHNGNPWPTISMVRSYVNGVFDQAIPVDEALEAEITFRPVTNFTLYFFRNETNHHVLVNSADNTIHIQKTGNKYQAWFLFTGPTDGQSDKVYFEDKRLQYAPELLY